MQARANTVRSYMQDLTHKNRDWTMCRGLIHWVELPEYLTAFKNFAERQYKHSLLIFAHSAMNDKIHIRAFHHEDKAAVVNLLRLNTPQYFAPEEEKAFIHYLDHELEHYFILEADQQIVGCGGINFSGNPAVGKISWDMLHPEYQGKSLGSILLKHRIEKLREFPQLEKIIVRTSQLAYRFYEKNGFRLLEIKEDYWAKEFDLYHMEYCEPDQTNTP